MSSPRVEIQGALSSVTLHIVGRPLFTRFFANQRANIENLNVFDVQNGVNRSKDVRFSYRAISSDDAQ
jgi:hypothetical protein